jgi:hypothetical protein
MLVMLLGATAIVRWDIAAGGGLCRRCAHRTPLLSQRAAQLDAVLATLMLVAPSPMPMSRPSACRPCGPAVLAVQRSDAEHPWPDAALAAAERRSDALAARQAPCGAGRCGSSAPAVHGWCWPATRPAGPCVWTRRAWCRPKSGPSECRAGARIAGGRCKHAAAAPGCPDAAAAGGLTPGFTFAKVLATPSQPFELRLQRATGPAQWPWAWLLVWAAACCSGDGAVGTAALARRSAARPS